jgi:hypothetical protein
MTLFSRTSRSRVASRPKSQNSRSLPPREINGSRQSSALVAPKNRLTFRNCLLSPESRIELQRASSVVAITRPLGRTLDPDTTRLGHHLAPGRLTRPLASATRLTEHSTIQPMEQQPMGCQAQAHLTTTASLHIKHVQDYALQWTCFTVDCDLLRMNNEKN